LIAPLSAEGKTESYARMPAPNLSQGICAKPCIRTAEDVDGSLSSIETLAPWSFIFDIDAAIILFFWSVQYSPAG